MPVYICITGIHKNISFKNTVIMRIRNLLWLSAALLVFACTDEEDVPMASSSPVKFSAVISESRVNDNAWEPGDEVGISMSVSEGATTNNVCYTAQSVSGNFEITGKALCFPDENPSDVTFYAYYPYSTDIAEGNKLTFDVDGKTDVLWTKKEVIIDEQSSNCVELNFSHALSKVILTTEGFPDDIEVSLSESYSQATLDLMTGTVTGSREEDYFIRLQKEAEGKYSVIVLPVASANKTLTIVSDSKNAQWKYTIASATYEGGHQYVYKVVYENTGGISVEESASQG